MIIVSLVQMINLLGQHHRSNIVRKFVNNDNNNNQSNETRIPNNLTNNNNHSTNANDDDDDYDLDEELNILDRFPSITSPSVQLIFAIITIANGIVGIVAITKEQTSLLSLFSFVLIISFSTKLLFLIGKNL